MASTVNSFGFSPCSALDIHKQVHSRYHILRCLSSRDPAALSSDSVKVNGSVNGTSSSVKEMSKKASVDLGNGRANSANVEEEVKLETLWDDGYGTQTVKDYLDYAKDIIKPDGGPVRWFSPIECGAHLNDSPVLLFLPGMDGLGLGLILHHKSLGKVFDVRCMHIPVQDRTPFEGLVDFIEETVKTEHSSTPNKPIYLIGDSFGGCLALAVAARNPKIDLVLVLANPATSFGRSQTQHLLPLLEALPDELHTSTVPYLLSFVMGDPMKMASVDINTMLSTTQYFERLASNLTALLPRLSGLSDIIPKETLLWKVKLLKTGAAYANSRLHAVKAEVLVLASGKDNMAPSRDEALRLLRSLQNCKVRYFKDNGHTILLEDGVNLLTIIKATCTYRRSRNHDCVRDFVPLSASEFKKAVEQNAWFHNYVGSVMLSTNEDGKIVRGLGGVPNEGPVLLVGYHMLMGLDIAPLIEEFLGQKKVMVHGMAHPTLFSHILEFENKEFSLPDYLRLYGAIPVSGSNLFKLLKTKSHVLLYPGGVREAMHKKGEAYKLFWPDEPEFVRMAARFGATIVPFGVIGEDDVAELVLDYDDLMKVPILGDRIRSDNEKYAVNVRSGMSGEIANQPLFIPGFLPKIPGRLYYLFGKPIETKGRKEMLKDKENARELYLEIKSQVESNLSYLLQKRNEDPYRNIFDRTIYRALRAPMDRVPTFEP